MTVDSVPIGGSVRITYLHNQPNLRINGINPLSTAAQIFELVQGVRDLQAATVNDAFLLSEFELEEES